MTSTPRALSPAYAPPSVPLIRRSMVTGAANNAEHRETAGQAGADAVMLDLEDTVPAAQKDQARAAMRDATVLAGRGGSDVLVRINSDDSHMTEEDLEASVWPEVDTLVLPKCESGESMHDIDETVRKLEISRGMLAGSLRFAVTIESVAGYANLLPLLTATSRVVSVTLGTEDFTHDIGAEPTATGDEVLLPQLQIILAARQARVTPLLGVLGSLSTLHDLEAVQRRAAWARGVGFKGAACSTRSHVPIANAAFRPSAEAADRARSVIEAYAESTQRGDGRIDVDGAIVDTPVVLRAMDLLAWSDAVDAMEHRKAERSSVDQ